MGSYRNNKNSKPDKSDIYHIQDSPFPAYQGDEPYIFISYSHDDTDLVYPEIERFHDDGYNIWYDEGIISGERWHEVVERALINSSLVVFFVSENAVESLNVRNEVFLASRKNIPIFPIFFEETELKYGLDLTLSSSPPITRNKLSEKEYVSMYRQKFETHGFPLNELGSNIEERIDNPPFPAYQGDDPYLFVSYSHDDSELVYPEIERFHNDKCNIWYDEGIPSGERWQEEVENALINSSLFIVFISRNSVASPNVRNEISLAIKKRIDIIPIYLESTNLEGHGLGLQIESIQSIYKHRMSDEGYIKRYRKEFKNHGFEIHEASTNPPRQIAKQDMEENETEQMINLIEDKIPNLDEETINDFSEIRELYDEAINDQNEDLLEFVEAELKSIFDNLYVNEYLELIKNAPKRLPYPSLKFKIPRSIRHNIIQTTFLELEKSSFADLSRADELIKQGHIQKDNADMKGLEKTVVQLYKESESFPISENLDETDNSLPKENIAEKIETPIGEAIHDTECLNEFERLNTTTNTIYDLGEYKTLIILEDGTNLTDWDNVENKDDILYVSEDLSYYKDLTAKYKDLKSLKAIVATNVDCNVTNLKEIFSGCSSLEDISALKEWNTTNVTDMNGMFKGCSSLEDISALKEWNTTNVTDMNGMFDGCTSLKDISALKDWKTANLADISGMFYGCSSLIDTNSLQNWDTDNLKFMSRVFRGCTSLVDVSALKNWNVISISDMNAMFKGCTSLIDIFSLKNWNVSNISDLSGVFYDCSSLEDILPLKNWKTKNVSDMNGMFKGCSSLEDISALKDWKTANVVDMSGMFENCTSLADIFSLKNWNTKKLKDISQMFRNCSSLEDASALDNWDLNKVMYKNEMFEGCSNIKELPKWYKS